MYTGIDEELFSDPVALLRWAYEIAKDHFDVRYGIAYKMPLDDEPDCYAHGSVKRSAAEVLDIIRHRDEWERRKKTADELWQDELGNERRHLAGLFRGAYPASILSDAHVQAANLHSQPIGTLSKLDASLWLWELSDRELPKAEALLKENHVLVSQARLS